MPGNESYQVLAVYRSQDHINELTATIDSVSRSSSYSTDSLSPFALHLLFHPSLYTDRSLGDEACQLAVSNNPLDAACDLMGSLRNSFWVVLSVSFPMCHLFLVDRVCFQANDDGSMLIVANSFAGELFAVDPETGDAAAIDLGGVVVPGDGLVRRRLQRALLNRRHVTARACM